MNVNAYATVCSLRFATKSVCTGTPLGEGVQSAATACRLTSVMQTKRRRRRWLRWLWLWLRVPADVWPQARRSTRQQHTRKPSSAHTQPHTCAYIIVNKSLYNTPFIWYLVLHRKCIHLCCVAELLL